MHHANGRNPVELSPSVRNEGDQGCCNLDGQWMWHVHAGRQEVICRRPAGCQGQALRWLTFSTNPWRSGAPTHGVGNGATLEGVLRRALRRFCAVVGSTSSRRALALALLTPSHLASEASHRRISLVPHSSTPRSPRLRADLSRLQCETSRFLVLKFLLFGEAALHSERVFKGVAIVDCIFWVG